MNLKTFFRPTAAAVICCFLFMTVAARATDDNYVSSSSDLQSLSLNCGALNPAFSSDITSYTVVSDGIVSTLVTPGAADPGASVTVNGALCASGSCCKVSIPMNGCVISVIVTGKNTASKKYTVVVTLQTGSSQTGSSQTGSSQSGSSKTGSSQSGSSQTGSSKTGSSQTVSSKSVSSKSGSSQSESSPGLSGIKLSSGTLSPAFGTETCFYSANVKYSIDSVTITPTALNSKETVTINSISMKSGSDYALPLAVGDNTVTIIVTSGGNSKSYTVAIKRAAKAAGDREGLMSLSLSSGILSPAFDPDVYVYSATVGNDVEKLSVSAEAADTDAVVKINGSASDTVSLGVGSNIIKVTVKETDDTVITYTVNLFRKYETKITVSSQNASGAYCAAVPDYVSLYGDDDAFTFNLGDNAIVMPVASLKLLKGTGGLTVSCGETQHSTVQKASAAAPDNCAVAGGVDIALSGGNAGTNKACAINAKATLRLSSGEKAILKHGVPEVYCYNSKGTLTETDADFDIAGGTVKITAASSGTYVIAAALSNAAISYTVTADPHYAVSGGSRTFTVKITRGSYSARLSCGQLMVVTTLSNGRQTFRFQKVSGNDCKIRVTVGKKAVRSAVYLTGGGFSGKAMPKTYGLTQFIKA